MTNAGVLIVALAGADALAAGLARRLRCAWTPLAQHRFPDGETLVRLDAPVQGRCVVLAGSLNDPDARTLPLLFAADAARELGAARVGLIAPYLAYMRQDQRFHPGEAVTSRSYARLLSSSLDFLVTVDPHLHRWQALEQIYPIRTEVVASAPPVARWIGRHLPDPLVIGPDEESAQWVAQVARLAGAPWGVMRKTRHGDRDVAVELQVQPGWQGRTPVLLDDIVSSGATLVAAHEALARAGLAAPVCIGVHALFAQDSLQRLHQAGIARVVTTDTVPHPSNAIAMAPALARALCAVVSGA